MLASLAPGHLPVFFGMMVLQLLFVLFLMVETRGRSLESVAHALERREAAMSDTGRIAGRGNLAAPR